MNYNLKAKILSLLDDLDEAEEIVMPTLERCGEVSRKIRDIRSEIMGMNLHRKDVVSALATFSTVKDERIRPIRAILNNALFHDWDSLDSRYLKNIHSYIVEGNDLCRAEGLPITDLNHNIA